MIPNIVRQWLIIRSLLLIPTSRPIDRRNIIRNSVFIGWWWGGIIVNRVVVIIDLMNRAKTRDRAGA